MTEKKLEQKQPKDHKALAKKLQQYVAPRLKIKDALNSVALVTSPKGNIFESAGGYADQPRDKPLTRDAQFLAGSIAKNFTAFALVTALHDQALSEDKALHHSPDRLKQTIQHKLHLPLSHYLNPKDPIWDGRMPDWAKTVTLHQLLTHTSGLKCFKRIAETAAHELSKIPGCPLSKFVDLFKDASDPWDSSQNEKPFNYANSNYLLAGYVAMQVLKSDPEKFLEDFFDPLFKKLGMVDTGFPSKERLVDLRKNSRYSRLVFAHVVDLDQEEAVRSQYVDTVAKSLNKPGLEEGCLPFASGNLVTTAADLAIWFRALCGGSPYIPAVISEIIQAKDCRIKFDRSPGYCGYGLVRHEKEGQVHFYEIHGSISIFSASAAYYPEQEICYVELSNMRREGGAFKKLGDVRCGLTPIIHEYLKLFKHSVLFFQPMSSRINPKLVIHKLSEVEEVFQKQKWINLAAKWIEDKWGYIRKLGLEKRRSLIEDMEKDFYIVTYTSTQQPIGIFALFDSDKQRDFMQPFSTKSLMYFYVDENYRSLGFGSEMLKLAKQKCKEEGIQCIDLDTLTPTLNKFYINHGAEISGDGECFGFPTTQLSMGLK